MVLEIFPLKQVGRLQIIWSSSPSQPLDAQKFSFRLDALSVSVNAKNGQAASVYKACCLSRSASLVTSLLSIITPALFLQLSITAGPREFQRHPRCLEQRESSLGVKHNTKSCFVLAQAWVLVNLFHFYSSESPSKLLLCFHVTGFKFPEKSSRLSGETRSRLRCNPNMNSVNCPEFLDMKF